MSTVAELLASLEAAVSAGDPMDTFDATLALAAALGETHGRLVASTLARAYLDRNMAQFAARNLADYTPLPFLAACA